ncbi:Coiled-coil domain-containing protein 22, partial [Nymphaea thermarum]
EETKNNLILSGQSEKPEVQEKLRQLDEIGKEIVDMMSRVIKREEEYSKLSMGLEKQPKMAPRSYYIQRITELSKNSWKQDADIKQIMKDTWQLQLEINSIQERLGRTYTVVDDAVFRYISCFSY